ncbi:MAG: AAA family ATPase [Planctomycetota bacterium]
MSQATTTSQELDQAPPFDVLDEIGRGATSVVERVRLGAELGPLRSGSFAARKRALGPSGAAVLEREARIAGIVRHPRLVHLLAWWRGPQGPELLFELLPGETLDRFLEEEGALPEPVVRRAGSDLAGALAALHTAGLAHGDPSLANARADESGRAVLLDLGNVFELATGEGPAAAGTLAYLAPERLRGGPPSPAADVFGLGVQLYVAATGRHPFAPSAFAAGAEPPDLATEEGERLLAALEHPRYLPPSRIAPRVSPLLDVLLAEMLDRRPEHRPSAATVSEVLAQGEDAAWWKSRSAVAQHAPNRELLDDALTLPLVGREAALARLDEAYRYCIDPTTGGSVVLVRGRKGSGRSRLVHHFVDRVRRESEAPLLLYARASEDAESRPHGAALRLLERWLMIEPSARPTEYEREILSRTVPPRETDVLMSALDPKGIGLLGGSVGRALVRWVRALVAQQHTILFVDDLHAARSSTLATVERLIEALADTRATIVLGVGDEVAPARPRSLARLVARIEGGGAGHYVVQLGPLGLDEVRAIVAQRFAERDDEDALVRVLLERSQGLPGLLTELLRTLFERGELLEDENGRWRLTIGLARVPDPKSVAEGVADRLEALESRGRRWLERLSVIGSRIDPESAYATFPTGRRSDLDKALALLVRRGWLEPIGNHYRFARPSLQEGVYAALDEDRRRRLHRLVAKSLDVEDPSLDDRFQRAWHLRAAHEHRTLVDELAVLLPLAQRAASPLRVLRLAHWAVEALDALPESDRRSELQLEFLEYGADAAGRTGARESERRFLDRLAEVQPDSARRPDAAARLYYLHGRALSDTGQLGVARGLLRAAIQASERAGSRALLGRSLRLMAMVQLRAGRTDLARDAATR